MSLRFGSSNFYIEPNRAFKSAKSHAIYEISRLTRKNNGNTISNGQIESVIDHMELYGCNLPNYFYLTDYVFDEDIFQNAQNV